MTLQHIAIMIVVFSFFLGLKWQAEESSIQGRLLGFLAGFIVGLFLCPALLTLGWLVSGVLAVAFTGSLPTWFQ